MIIVYNHTLIIISQVELIIMSSYLHVLPYTLISP